MGNFHRGLRVWALGIQEVSKGKQILRSNLGAAVAALCSGCDRHVWAAAGGGQVILLWGRVSEPAAKQSSKKHRRHQPPPPNVNKFWLEALSVVQVPCGTLEWNTSLIKTALTNASVCHLPRSVAPTRICFYLSYFLPGNKRSDRLTAQPVPLWEGQNSPLSLTTPVVTQHPLGLFPTAQPSKCVTGGLQAPRRFYVGCQILLYLLGSILSVKEKTILPWATV